MDELTYTADEVADRVLARLRREGPLTAKAIRVGFGRNWRAASWNAARKRLTDSGAVLVDGHAHTRRYRVSEV